MPDPDKAGGGGARGEVLDFGFGEAKQALGGRRKKTMQQQQKKIKAGSFGGCMHCTHIYLRALGRQRVMHVLSGVRAGKGMRGHG